jgi:hypothetical protein
MTREEAERARDIFLAALREGDPLHPIPDSATFVLAGREDGSWDIRFWYHLIQRSPEEIYRAAVLCTAAIDQPIACFTCWNTLPSSTQAIDCARGDCRAEVKQ